MPSAPYIKPAVAEDEVGVGVELVRPDGVMQDTVVVVKVTSAKVLVTLLFISTAYRKIEVL
jgi:hypothetical protein